jgi:uncharacterized membrane protein
MKSSGHDNFLVILITLSIAIGAFLGIILPYQDMPAFSVFRIIFGSLFILFLPGYHLTRVFFGKREIDRLERFALSFALSISVVPLLTFYANLLGLPITSLTVYGITLVIILLSILAHTFFPRHTHHGHDTHHHAQ